ncbi:MAG: 16S rRNA (cytosine(1402)-N(4))-methyltransferase RsmH [Candidatus Pacebacteria bacterium]|nr:16S rRNA (cytosine(1402)-N(4))-methyltransferase RsmH [Candidatus Paceibacterota bacterium]
MIHTPVLQKEVLEILNPKPNENFVDCTIGKGGHAKLILEKTFPDGKVLGIDWDPRQIENLKNTFSDYKKRIILVSNNFANLKVILKENKFKNISGILVDLGFSSWHLEEGKRGFSFLKNEPLDMRYSPENPNTAEKILNYSSEIDIEKILRECGEEQFSEKIAKEIIEIRRVKPIKSTFQLVEIIKRATPAWYQHRKIHFATKTFQAIRIAVNDELNNLKKFLPASIEVLEPKGKLAIISFHSLEDKIIKNFLEENGKNGLIKILTKKPIQPAYCEVARNNRARSAKLRAAEKI